MPFDLSRAIRPNILALQPYRCARDDYQSGVLLDANENSLGPSTGADPDLPRDLHRYPDPSHVGVKSHIARLRGLPSSDYVFLGVGSDEVIDLLIRISVAPAKEKILITPPTYGMYAVSAQVNDVQILEVPLQLSPQAGEGGETGRFSLQVDHVQRAIDADPSIKLIFLCSPGNPTGTLISLASIDAILRNHNFNGILTVDEAYIDFAGTDVSAVSLIQQYPNLCVMQTLSKSFGLAAIRLGIALAQPPLIQVLSKTKAPYNVSLPTAQIALRALAPSSIAAMRAKASQLIDSRATLLQSLSNLRSSGVGPPIGANDANFVVIPILGKEDQPDNDRAFRVYKSLAEEHGVVVRYRGKEPGCTGCLRITVGTEEENAIVVNKLHQVLQKV